MEPGLEARAIEAASSLARDLGLEVDEVVVMQSSNAVALRLLPCDVVTRTAVRGQEVATFEVSLARALAAVDAPVASLEPRVEAQVYERDGFAVTYWTHYDSVTVAPRPADYADALHRLHAGMRCVDVPVPHCTDRIAEAEALVADPLRTPALDEAGRALLREALHDVRRTLDRQGTPDQLLHGEPHPGNVLATRSGPVFIDLETCCRGPVELDVAHVPDAVGEHYPGLDPTLLQDCRRLVLAMVAAWRFDARDEFPEGLRQGWRILEMLRNGPPWPALGELPTG